MKTRTTPHNPKCDDLCERWNKTLQQMLKWVDEIKMKTGIIILSGVCKVAAMLVGRYNGNSTSAGLGRK